MPRRGRRSSGAPPMTRLALSKARDREPVPIADGLAHTVINPLCASLPRYDDIGGLDVLPSVHPANPLVEERLGGVERTGREIAVEVAPPPLAPLGLRSIRLTDIIDVPIIIDLEEHALADDVPRLDPIEGPLRGAALEQDARVQPPQVCKSSVTAHLLQLRAADADRDALAATGEEMHAHDIAVTRITHLKDPAVLDVAMHDARDDGVQVVALHGGVPSLAVCVALIIATYNTTKVVIQYAT